MNAWGKAWGKAWGGSWGLFLVPATELTPRQQLFVRTALEQVYSSDDTSVIISFAKQHSLSVLDAVACVTANTAEKHLFITPKVQRGAGIAGTDVLLKGFALKKGSTKPRFVSFTLTRNVGQTISFAAESDCVYVNP